MNGYWARTAKLGAVSILAAMALACSPPMEEEIIEILEDRVFEMEDSVKNLKADIEELQVLAVKLQTVEKKVATNQEHIAQGSAGGSDPSTNAEFAALAQKVVALEKGLTAAQNKINTLENGRRVANVPPPRQAPAPSLNTTASPPRSQPRPEPAPQVGHYYQLRGSETLESVAKTYGMSVDKLRADNNLSPGTQPRAGSPIWISRPPSARKN